MFVPPRSERAGVHHVREAAALHHVDVVGDPAQTQGAEAILNHDAEPFAHWAAAFRDADIFPGRGQAVEGAGSGVPAIDFARVVREEGLLGESGRGFSARHGPFLVLGPGLVRFEEEMEKRHPSAPSCAIWEDLRGRRLSLCLDFP